VGNVKVHQKSIPVQLQQGGNKIQFMPEGGDLIMGLPNRVAFKMLQPNGLSANGTGYIEDNTGNKLTELTTGHASMGSFYFTPESGKTYKAVINYSDGKTQTQNLPEALKEGYVLKVSQGIPGFVNLSIGVTEGLIKNQKATILIQKQGKALFMGGVAISRAQSAIKLPLTDYPPGIIQVTLFDENMKPVCERLFFNLNKQAILPLAATTPAGQLAARKPVVVSLQAGEAGDSLRIGTFSASVINLARLPQLADNSNSIISSLLLTSELKGNVEDPDYYFESDNPAKKSDLDNLLLCQGWRHIVWDDVKKGKAPVINYQPEKGFSITGVVTRRNGQPVPDAKITILSTSSMAHMDTMANKQGHFIFDHLLISDSTRFAIHVTGNAGKDMVIKLDEKPAIGITATDDIVEPIDEIAYQAYLKTNYSQLPDW
jgi:hypothetical protein